MDEFRAGRIWGLESAPTGKALTTGFAASDGNPIVCHGPCDLVCDAEVSGVAADSVEFQIDFSLDADDFAPFPSLADAVTMASFGSRVYTMDGAVGTQRIIFSIPWACTVRLMAKRTGGAVGTLLDVYAWSRMLGDGGGGMGALSVMGGSAGACSAAYDPVSDSLRTSEQAGPETALDGETLFDVTNGVDGTYDYYVEHDERHSFALSLILSGGSGTVTVTLWAAEQDDGTAIAARNYVDVTNDIYGAATITATDRVIDDAGKLRDAKSIRVRVVAATGGANDADWTGYWKASY